MSSPESGLYFEAEEAVKECAFAVDFVELSKKLMHTPQAVFINMKTKEKICYCVELSSNGFKIVGQTFDHVTSRDSPCYETLGSLLNQVSPLYVELFGNALVDKLSQLKQDSPG